MSNFLDEYFLAVILSIFGLTAVAVVVVLIIGVHQVSEFETRCDSMGGVVVDSACINKDAVIDVEE